LPLVPRRAWAPLALVAAVVLINSSVVFCGRTLLNIAPSNGLLPGKPYGYEGPELDQTTTVDQVGSFNDAYAWDVYTANCLKRAVIPFWDPYQGLGQPFLSVGSSAVLYPINWLHLVLPPAWWDVVYILNWLLGSLFLYAYIRVLDVDQRSAFIGALALFACGSMQIYLPCREVVAVAAWWPLLLYSIERSFRQPGWRGRHLALAIGIFCSVAGGQPEVTFVGLLAAGVYAITKVLSVPKEALRFVLNLAPGVAAGLLLSTPHWLNFVNYAFTSYSEHIAGGGKGLIHLSLQTFPSYLFPYFYGRVQHHPFGAALFNWTYSPGWLTPICLFFGLASVSALRDKRRVVVGFLLLVSALTLAKIFNMPGVRSLGNLPFFERVIFTRYAAFLPAFALAALAAVGLSLLAQANNRVWLFWIMAWTVAVSAAFALGVISLWAPLSQAAQGSEGRNTFIIFGLGGLIWAVIQPFGLWWVKHRCEDSRPLYAIAAFGILLHAVSFAPNGYSLRTYAALSLAGLLAYLFLAAVIGTVSHRRPFLIMNFVGIVIVVLLPVVAAIFSAHGLPHRYDPLTPPHYLTALLTSQDAGSFRSYSLGPVPGPDFAAPFELSSLDTVDAISPPGAATFLGTYLDPGLSGLYFVGHRATTGPPYMSALDQIKWNKRYYDLAAVRYMVTTDQITGGADPNAYDSLGAFLGAASPVPIRRPLRAAFTPTTSEVTEVEVPLGTYERKNPGTITLEILDAAGKLLESSEVPSLDLVNNAPCRFHLSRIRGVNRRQLQLVLDFRPGSDKSMIAAYAPPDPSVIGFAFRALSPEKPFGMAYRDEETGTTVWENSGATPRVFLAPELRSASSSGEALSRLDDIADLSRTVLVEGVSSQTDPDPSRSPGVLREFQLHPNEVTVKYNAEMPGILTLVDAFSDGWHAEINGREAPVLRVDGVFRGVKIETPGEIAVRFWYRPPQWNLSLILCGIGFIVLLLPYPLALVARKPRQ
jgi:hypothetical protein